MRTAANILLLPAYVVALAVLVRIRVVVQERRAGWHAALVGATVVIVIGHLLAGRAIPAAINAAAALVMIGAWWWLGRHRGARD